MFADATVTPIKTSVVKTTTDKLQDVLNEMTDVTQAVWVGGRDWVVIGTYDNLMPQVLSVTKEQLDEIKLTDSDTGPCLVIPADKTYTDSIVVGQKIRYFAFARVEWDKTVNTKLIDEVFSKFYNSFSPEIRPEYDTSDTTFTFYISREHFNEERSAWATLQKMIEEIGLPEPIVFQTGSTARVLSYGSTPPPVMKDVTPYYKFRNLPRSS